MCSEIIIIIIIIIIISSMIISTKTFNDREKSTPYECGFDPLNSTTESFSIQFFLISIMFLTFDIEIVVLIPMIPTIISAKIQWLMSSMTIMIILITGLFMEWMESSINWE